MQIQTMIGKRSVERGNGIILILTGKADEIERFKTDFEDDLITLYKKGDGTVITGYSRDSVLISEIGDDPRKLKDDEVILGIKMTDGDKNRLYMTHADFMLIIPKLESMGMKKPDNLSLSVTTLLSKKVGETVITREEMAKQVRG